MLDVQQYQWIADQRYSAVTVALFDGVTEDEVIRAYGGDPRSSETATFDEAFNSFEPGAPFWVQTLTVGSCIVAIENNGYLGSAIEGGIEALTQRARFGSVKWSATGGVPFLYIVNGDVVADFDALSLAGGGTGGGDPVPEWVTRVAWSDVDVQAACLALLSDVMNVPIEEKWFMTPLRTTRLPGLD
ncbi:hypothetical protein GCM10010178_42520 [Lentzea flava]|uniref:Barstar (Barnase inhibitor) n=2 Tax=Lentzea flava TaxID=103732 RepID=A0ABQ2UMY3_9PSEU|nr:DUF6461 domain-containing protein [Lentzea flava]MCP2200019.1 hypothetical protein [Lentzea flava]GGU45583.1 hypothetical protein GCM10010178_42520 [Lentzea flava]